ncbi:MAG: S8 family serine peptidase [Vulcanimicrobiaceae bacterium]
MFTHRNRLLFATAIAALALAACGGNGQNGMMPSAAPGQTAAQGAAGQSAAATDLKTAEGAAFDLIRARRPMVVPETVGTAKSMCPGVVAPYTMHCMALMQTPLGGVHRLAGTINSAPAGGYAPSDLQNAYDIVGAAVTNGKSQTVALIDAYNDPNAEADLGVYRSYYKLPACTTANKCFRKVSQTGTTTYPAADEGWAAEISLDIDMVSATCPNCHILLVEANDNGDANLDAAVNEAVALGANDIRNSYGGDEYTPLDPAFHHYGHVFTASAGDGGYYPQAPAAYSTVIGVGGTTLKHMTSGSRAWTETAWADTGSGCSLFVSKPSWQSTENVCPTRQIADVSAVADPNTGVNIYDSYPNPYGPTPGWLVFGGTSAASPIIASFFALAGNAATETYGTQLWAKGGSSSFYDVTSGNNGSCPAVWQYICNARVGYDGPTGWGTPHSIGAF